MDFELDVVGVLNGCTKMLQHLHSSVLKIMECNANKNRRGEGIALLYFPLSLERGASGTAASRISADG